MEDSAIIDLFFERSEQAVAELEQKYGAAVRKTAGNLLRDRQDAEECANDTYLRVWNSIPPQRPDFLGSFVCRITRNLAVSMLRAKTAAKRNRELDLVLDELEACIPSPVNVEADYELKELTAEINCFLSRLSYFDRFLFVRRYWYADSVGRYWYADSVGDIAAEMQIPENRVSVRLFRLREKLRKTLQKEGLLA